MFQRSNMRRIKHAQIKYAKKMRRVSDTFFSTGSDGRGNCESDKFLTL